MAPAAAGGTASTRWCPTPEQLMILEEMYKGGIRTPNAAQIQQITAHLSLYGKIEGKNVFYWFQNHKARDRQKLRRRLTKQLMIQHQHHQQLQQQLYQQQVEYFPHHQQPSSNHLLHYSLEPAAAACICTTTPSLPSPPPPPPLGFHHQASHYNSPPFLTQERVQDACSGPQMINYTWKMDIPEQKEMEKPVSRSDGDDWVIIADVGPASTCCSIPTSRPLRTLQLFPMKDESPNDLLPTKSLHPSLPPTIPL